MVPGEPIVRWYALPVVTPMVPIVPLPWRRRSASAELWFGASLTVLPASLLIVQRRTAPSTPAASKGVGSRLLVVVISSTSIVHGRKTQDGPFLFEGTPVVLRRRGDPATRSTVVVRRSPRHWERHPAAAKLVRAVVLLGRWGRVPILAR